MRSDTSDSMFFRKCDMVEALLLSVDEPQLKRSLESISNQTVPFTNLVHINGIFPQSVAYNRGVSLIKDEWFMFIGGDMCLYPNAVAHGIIKIGENGNDKVCGHIFKVYDTFIQANLGVGFYRTEVLRSFKIRDRLCNDRKLGTELKQNGWIEKKHGEALGTHFDKPDEFQVFRRFFILALKFTGRFIETTRSQLLELEKNTGDLLYGLGVKAIDFGMVNRNYPGSHNINFDRKMFEEFKES